MKAYHIRYDKPGVLGNTEIVLANNEEEVAINLSKKDPDFKNDNDYYKIRTVKELSLDAVHVSNLSVTELLMLIRKE